MMSTSKKEEKRTKDLEEQGQWKTLWEEKLIKQHKKKINR